MKENKLLEIIGWIFVAIAISVGFFMMWIMTGD